MNTTEEKKGTAASNPLSSKPMSIDEEVEKRLTRSIATTALSTVLALVLAATLVFVPQPVSASTVDASVGLSMQVLTTTCCVFAVCSVFMAWSWAETLIKHANEVVQNRSDERRMFALQHELALDSLVRIANGMAAAPTHPFNWNGHGYAGNSAIPAALAGNVRRAAQYTLLVQYMAARGERNPILPSGGQENAMRRTVEELLLTLEPKHWAELWPVLLETKMLEALCRDFPVLKSYRDASTLNCLPSAPMSPDAKLVHLKALDDCKPDIVDAGNVLFNGRKIEINRT